MQQSGYASSGSPPVADSPQGHQGNHHSRHGGLALLLAALSMAGPFSIDTFFPSFHAIAEQFSVSAWAVQQTLTVYMLPLSFMSLVQGPLSDAVGRRRVIIIGLAVYTVASIGCTFAPTFATLLVFRAFQGASVGVGVIVGRAVIRDLYDGPQAQKLLSLVTMIFGFAPAVAPVIGGWIHVTLGWRAVFGFMALFGAILCITSYLKLPETHPPERRPRLHVPELTRTALRVAGHGEFLLLALGMGANFATMMCFIGAAPMVVLDHWHLRETQFAALFFPVISGFVIGAWISGRMAGRIPTVRQTGLGFTLALSGSILTTIVHALMASPPLLLQQVLLTVIAVGVQMVGPTLSLRMLDLFPKARGSAASVQSCVSIVISAIVFGALAPLAGGSMLTLSEASLCAALIAFALWRAAQHRVSFAHRPS
jgi:DHA1 family bicyclomycin/chloramphenicol resistance-like MFS transporter